MKDGSAKNQNISVFDDSNNSYEDAAKKLDEQYKKAQELYKDRKANFYKNEKEKYRNVKGGKGTYDHLVKREGDLDFAMDIYDKAIKFMHEHNNLYRRVKNDLTGTDQYKVVEAARKIQDIYPSSLIKETGRLKQRTKSWYKTDAPIVKGASKQVEVIRNMYKQLINGCKLLGKVQNVNQLHNLCVGGNVLI